MNEEERHRLVGALGMERSLRNGVDDLHFGFDPTAVVASSSSSSIGICRVQNRGARESGEEKDLQMFETVERKE